MPWYRDYDDWHYASDLEDDWDFEDQEDDDWWDAWDDEHMDGDLDSPSAEPVDTVDFSE